jgi:photosystem II stability/assembly factor-like uncharacterized protein
MKRKLLLASCVIALVTSANAQWHEQNSMFSVASRGMNDFDVVDSNVVWGVAYDGSGGNATIRDFCVTKTGGGTWFAKTLTATGLNTSYGLANISAIDKDTAYASVYPTGTATAQGVYKTTDGGNTWAKVSTGAFTAGASFINVVHMFDAQNGVAMGDPAGGYFEIYTTSNYGVTWTRVPQADINFAPLGSGATAEYGTVGYFTAIGNSIWYPTNSGRIFVSSDKGLTWQLGTTPYDSTSGVNTPSLAFKDNMNGLAIASDGTTGNVDAIIQTTDGGLTWTTLADTATGNVSDRNAISFVPGTTNTYFITSANATTGGLGSAYTEDGGQTWNNIDNEQHTCVAFSDINNGWSGGFNAVTGGVSTGGIFKWGTVKDPDTTTGILSTRKNADLFNVFPNPSKGLVYVHANVKGNTTIRIFDITGKVVLQKDFSTINLLSTSFDLSSFSKGLYVVELNNEGNLSTKRVSVN